MTVDQPVCPRHHDGQPLNSRDPFTGLPIKELSARGNPAQSGAGGVEQSGHLAAALGGAHSQMEEIGYELYFEDTVTCRRAMPRECERLELAPGDPVLTIWRRCYDQSDRVVEVTFRVIPGDRLEQIYRYAATA